MKKVLVLICGAVLALVSCSKEMSPGNQGIEQATPIVFNLSATHPDGPATKAVKTGWETGDVVFVFFEKQVAPAYLEMKYDGEKWKNTPNGLSLREGETGTMTAVYLPFGSDAKVVADGTDYRFDKTYYSYFLTSSMDYTVSDGEVSGTFSMQIPDGYVQFFMGDDVFALDSEIELREPHLTPQGIESISSSGSIALKTLAHGAPLPGYLYDKKNKDADESAGILFSGILSDDARYDKTGTPSDYHFTLVINGWDGMYYNNVFTGKMLYRGEKVGRALKFSGDGWEPIMDYKPIDIGCDVDGKRVYWASRNLGAASDFPTSSADADIEATYGDYYAWGETETYYESGYAMEYPQEHWKADMTDGYAWGSYKKFNPTGDGSTFTKYTGSDYDTLLPDDDVASVVAKGTWRMPTRAEWSQLRSTSFNWIWDNESNGCKVTSNVEGYDGSDGPWIFLPASCCWQGNDFIRLGGGEDPLGVYWSASLSSPSPSEASFVVCSTFGDEGGTVERFGGFSVRPVTY